MHDMDTERDQEIARLDDQLRLIDEYSYRQGDSSIFSSMYDILASHQKLRPSITQSHTVYASQRINVNLVRNFRCSAST